MEPAEREGIRPATLTPAAPARPSPWRRRMIAFPLLYLALALLVMLFQRRLIYLPTRVPSAGAVELAGRNGFVPWTDPHGTVIGWKLPARGPSPRGTFLIFHGNAGWAGQRDYLAQPIHDAVPVDVCVLEYPGYGGRSGEPTQASLLAAARQALAVLGTNRPIYVVGESLGTGVACAMAGEFPERIAGLLLCCPYDRLTSVGQRQMPFLPARWLMWDRFPSIEWLRRYSGPVGFLLAEDDRVVPKELGRRLADAYGGPKQVWVTPGGHNDAPARPPEWWRSVWDWWHHPPADPGPGN